MACFLQCHMQKIQIIFSVFLKRPKYLLKRRVCPSRSVQSAAFSTIPHVTDCQLLWLWNSTIRKWAAAVRRSVFFCPANGWWRNLSGNIWMIRAAPRSPPPFALWINEKMPFGNDPKGHLCALSARRAGIQCVMNPVSSRYTIG